ncbi:MAG: copper chaperone PCu(A)C [Roseicyclus sp.]
MSLRSAILACSFAVLPALAHAHVEIENVYARVASPVAQSAAVYMTIRNHSDDDDRVFQVTSDVAQRIELHTTEQDDAGVMRMLELEDGLPIASNETVSLMPGGNHVMLMGLNGPLEQGDTFEMTVFFDVWLPMVVTVTVDNEAAAALAEGHGDGDGHGHSDH